MTSTGKLVAGALILSAAYLTANYLHEPNQKTSTAPTTQVQVTRLNWQASRTENLQAVAQPSEFANHSTGRDAGFARLASAQEAVAPPEPFASSPQAQGEFVGGTPSPTATSRYPLPFTVASTSAPNSELKAVDDEEVDSSSLAREFVEHTVQFGETLPEIALKYTGRRESYMAIYQANLDVLSNPAEVSPGIILKIPVR